MDLIGLGDVSSLGSLNPYLSTRVLQGKVCEIVEAIMNPPQVLINAICLPLGLKPVVGTS